LTDADLVALGILTGGPAHGHGIWSRLSACDIEDWAVVSRAQVYYSLGKLADQGLIRPAKAASADVRRVRRTWCITPAGRRALTAALASTHWAEQRVVPPFLTWVGLSGYARLAARRKILAARRLFVEAEHARERDTLADLERLPADADGADIARLMVGHVIRQLKLELEWLDELEGLLAG
jgi:DNA-binding PadR family transcriptional regulator